MKNKFKLLTSVMLLLTMGIGQVWGEDYVLSIATTTEYADGETATKSQTFVSGGQTFTIAKGSTVGTAGKMGTNLLKLSKNATYTITLPDGFTANSINFVGYANNASASSIDKVNGNTVNFEFPGNAVASSEASWANHTATITGTTKTITFQIANSQQIGVIITITGTASSGGGEEEPETPTTGTIDNLVEIDSEFTFEPTAALTTNTLYESNKIISLGGSTYNNGIQIKNNRQLAFKVAAGAKIVVTFNERSGHDRNMQIGTTSAGTDLASSAYSTVKAIRATAGIVYISASSDLYLTKLEISYPTLYTITYDYNGGTLKEGESDLAEGVKEAGETFTVASAAVLDAPEGKVFDKWNDGSADYAPNATYTVGTANVTLTAQWRNASTKYAVTYDLGDYTAGVAPTEVNRAEGEVFAIKAATEWTDHDFLGWTCNIDAATYQAADYYTMTDAATTFTAQWQAYFTITYKDGDDVLDTEKVNAGDSPVGIADSAKELKSFLGWTLVGESTLVDPTTLTENTVLVAKWVDFDGCAYLAVDLTATDALSVGDNVALKASSFGGSVKVAGMKSSTSIQYNGYGLFLSGGGADSLRVTIGHQLQEGSKITVALRCTGTDTRGLKLLTKTGAEVAALGWTDGVANAEATFTYEVPENSALIGEKVFRLQRNNTIYLKYISVEDCAPQDFVVTYKDGETTLGTEYVFEDAHPTASGITTRKNGYVFQGWAETADDAVVNLNTITITAEKTLFAKYSARDCSGAGTKFKFQMKTDLTSGNVFAQTPNSVKATTANYLSELTGGEVEFSITGSNNNRILFYDEKAVGFANGTGGQITILLDCPLKENDEIRFINYASSGNSITLSDGTNSTTLNGNNAETVQTFVVPAEWETTGSYELTMVRAEKSAKLTYFEVYRCPALTSVTLEGMNLKVGKTGTPVMILNPEGALVTSQAWEITASTATGTTIDASTGLITAGETTGEITVKVTLNGDKEATCTVKVVAGFEAPKSVTETTIWDWEPVATAENGPSISAPDTVLANYLAGDEWEMLAGNSGGRPYRSTTYKAYQGTSLYFKAALPGMLRIYAGSTGNDKKVYVNGIEVGTTGPKAYLNNIVVPAGHVYITSESMRIYQMKFDTDLSAYELTDNLLGGVTRENVTEGRYGTICLPNSGVMVGAAIFEVAYRDEADAHKKIFFDEVLNGEMVAGRPYIFQPREGVTHLSVFYTNQADSVAGNYRGLWGAYVQTVLDTDGSNYILLNNQYCRVANPNTSVGANRAYLKIGVDGGVPTNAVAPAPGRRRVSMSAQGEQVATGMSEEQSDNVQSAKIIIDGHMFILRGEKMYDATGQLVK